MPATCLRCSFGAKRNAHDKREFVNGDFDFFERRQQAFQSVAQLGGRGRQSKHGRHQNKRQYYPARSIVHRADPRFKLVILLLYLITVFFCSSFFSFGFMTFFVVYIETGTAEFDRKLGHKRKLHSATRKQRFRPEKFFRLEHARYPAVAEYEKDVMFGPKNLGLSVDEQRERAKQAIGLVGLNYNDMAERSPFELSGGQKRRVAIAGVLAMRPENRGSARCTIDRAG